ncbi:5-carboxymethylaminomethyluridine-tRNA synthase MnmEG, GTPase component [Campylobacter avium LMG 24591]|uniref:tRNA modification GTPase MnmE n=1 Tax=Campylobacter avium LMG 24591 TaxID=522484 RepID=A0A222MXK4_9BACT|nr:tRNA uridine-5-carboxymethylaminomethyl(34) synthesis GTPase MnmE [Campylobacter avium]ASQ30561.1 5-carboxymethylaminomethyluridine-tRNA synthase MnmEG, GTPase component [Campylobacter avium LMG 24591]OYD79658.1 5-carboxymethylaminomethyluridine-tRNA synthase MnmEG, GTPase component [Campylobacter avium]
MSDKDTIAAIATAYGIGSICILRLSGSKAYDIALEFSKKKALKPRYATLSKLYKKDGTFMDEAIILYFKAPFSFTGEDVVEFQTHGGFAVCRLILDEVLSCGARLANPGEFSKRAVLNGKMNLLKALSIQELISAKSINSAKIIARSLKGDLNKLLEKIRLDLVKTISFVETSIDYADDDLPKDLLAEIEKMCFDNANTLKKIYDLSKSRQGLIKGFKIAILGKPNVGKSSLLNKFLAYERAIVSNEAGTTRDFLEEELLLGTHLVRIIDTAGIRKADDKIEKKGIEFSKAQLKEADIILAIFDNSRAKDSEDDELLSLLQKSDKKIFYILNKCDLENNFKADINFLKLSVNEDISSLKTELIKYLDSLDSTDILVSNQSLLQAFKNAYEAIFRAKDLLDESSLELFSFELNLAIKEIAKFTKDFSYDELLDEMFSNFCLGK